MSRKLENARGFVGRAGVRLGAPGMNEEPLRLDLAGLGAEIDEAQRLAARLNPGAAGAASAHDQNWSAKTSRKP
jgi:hypothetical protein